MKKSRNKKRTQLRYTALSRRPAYPSTPPLEAVTLELANGARLRVVGRGARQAAPGIVAAFISDCWGVVLPAWYMRAAVEVRGGKPGRRGAVALRKRNAGARQGVRRRTPGVNLA